MPMSIKAMKTAKGKICTEDALLLKGGADAIDLIVGVAAGFFACKSIANGMASYYILLHTLDHKGDMVWAATGRYALFSVEYLVRKIPYCACSGGMRIVFPFPYGP